MCRAKQGLSPSYTFQVGSSSFPLPFCCAGSLVPQPGVEAPRPNTGPPGNSSPCLPFNNLGLEHDYPNLRFLSPFLEVSIIFPDAWQSFYSASSQPCKRIKSRYSAFYVHRRKIQISIKQKSFGTPPTSFSYNSVLTLHTELTSQNK